LLRAAKALVIAGALAACAQSTVPLDQLNARLAEADCTQAVRCGRYDSVAQCLAFARPDDPVTPSLAAAVAAGAVDYDAVQAAECVDLHANLSCNPADPVARTWPPATCRGVLGAYRKQTVACLLDEECASYHCQPDRFCQPDMCCPGTCGEPRYQAGIGGDCTNAPCAPIAWCAGGTCVPLLPRGSGCTWYNQCAFGLDCVGGLCVPPRNAGDACDPDKLEDCGSYGLALACDPDTRRCVVPIHGEGESCDDGMYTCRWGDLICNRATHVCERRARVGESCGACEAGAYCAYEPGTGAGICLPLVDDGSSCFGIATACRSGVCSSVDQRCVEPPVCF
jgi:hypothetical protein